MTLTDSDDPIDPDLKWQLNLLKRVKAFCGFDVQEAITDGRGTSGGKKYCLVLGKVPTDMMPPTLTDMMPSTPTGNNTCYGKG